MKTILTSALLTWVIVQAASAQPAETTPPPKSPSPPEKVDPAPKPQGPPIVVAPTPGRSGQPFVYEQKPVPAPAPPVQPQQAQAIIDRFKSAYPKLGSPRVLIFVNRELVDEKSGLKLSARTEKVDLTEKRNESDLPADPNAKTADPKTTRPDDIYPGRGKTSARTEQTVRENRYHRDDAPELSLADKQTVRDVERLFGRPLRMGGASLSDQRVATQLLGSKPFEGLTTEGEQARKDREVLSKLADVVVEVLISSKNVQVTELSGERTYTTPDIQATAIRLKDAKILGQAASADLPGRNFDVREVAEATALALMEDMLTGVE